MSPTAGSSGLVTHPELPLPVVPVVEPLIEPLVDGEVLEGPGLVSWSNPYTSRRTATAPIGAARNDKPLRTRGPEGWVATSHHVELWREEVQGPCSAETAQRLVPWSSRLF